MSIESRYRRLLRWYPRSWRERHGDIVLGTMLDRADAAGRFAPTMAERRAAALHGSAARLTPRLAVRAAFLSVVIAAALGVLLVWWDRVYDATGLVVTLSAFAVPVPLVVSLAAVFRARGWISDVAALTCIPLGVTGLALGTLAQLGWYLAFDAADAGTPASGLAAATWTLLGAGIVAGGGAAAIAASSALRRALPHRFARALIAAVLGLTAAGIVAWVLWIPFAGAAAAMATLTLAIATRRSETSRSAAHSRGSTERVGATSAQDVLARREATSRGGVRRRETSRSGVRGRATSRGVVVLLAVSVAIGILGVLAGIVPIRALPMGIGLHGDAVARAMSILLVAGVPLLAAIGLERAARGQLTRIHAWGPIALGTVAVAAIVCAYRVAPDATAMTPWLQAAAIAGGAAMAWAVALRWGILLAIATALTVTSTYGVMLAPAVAVAAPLLAAALLIRHSTRRRPRSGRTTPGSDDVFDPSRGAGRVKNVI